MKKAISVYTVEVDGVPVEIHRKAVRNINIRVLPPDGAVRMTVPVLVPEAYAVSFLRSRMPWIRKSIAKIKARPAVPAGEEEALKKEYREKLEQVVPGLIEKYTPVVGRAPSGYRFRLMKTRWGSCNVKTGMITLNLLLAAKPPECLEYVVVHEMTHLYTRYHDAVFYGYLDRFYPDWRRVRKLLG